MNFVDRLIAPFAPAAALKRAQARAALHVLMNYDAATSTSRGSAWRPVGTDADAASAKRARLAFVARDMVRNTPLALRAQQVIASNVVGDGIIPRFVGNSQRLSAQALSLVEAHFDTVAIDADGRQNLYGLQRLVMNTVVDAGEVLVRRRRLTRGEKPLPFQIQVLEPDFLDDKPDGSLPGGGWIASGIEYDASGNRVAYHLFDEHPGAVSRGFLGRYTSRRVPASEILHIYRQDRPGQMRGVSWFAPVAMSLQDLAGYQDAQLMRQKVAACFAAFRIGFEPKEGGADPLSSILPARVHDLGPGEDIKFSSPPPVDGYEDFTRSVMRSIAAGMGLTYESLSTDLKGTNFSNARMGRMEMDRNVSAWQWLLLIPQFLNPLGYWFIEAWAAQTGLRAVQDTRIEWVPPHRMLVDPTREIPALRDKVRAGFASRSGVVRELGYDPERLLQEQAVDALTADAAGLRFDSDPRVMTQAGQVQATEPKEDQNDDE